MTDDKKWRETLFLPKTSFPMKAGLPQLEKRLLQKWEEQKTYQQQYEAHREREKFVLHDGPPYANGDIHMGTAMQKILKDIVNRSQQLLGKRALYVPGWDCHGLPIEWKVEEKFREKGQTRDSIGRTKLRAACRAFAQKWVERQSQQFQRLGIWGRWDKPYLTMDKESEALIAAEFMKFAMSGSLYQGLKPVMWSVAEKTALAEAEIEYHEHLSTTLFVRFPLQGQEASVVIWTTTPWTLPANRAIAFSKSLSYGLYQTPDGLVALADELAENAQKAAEIEDWKRVGDFNPEGAVCAHPLKDLGYDFDVPLLAGDFVTAETGTGFVHIAPSHGRDDYELGAAHNIPPEFIVDDEGRYTDKAPHFTGAAILNPDGSQGDANQKVIEQLVAKQALFAQGKLRHEYPHSWRSKTPVIFRATPQWFISMEHNDLRQKALDAIDKVSWLPASGRNRIHAMVENRPDWVISRQRVWGVPLTIFANDKGEILRDEKVNQRIVEAIQAEGSDSWFDSPAEKFLGSDYDANEWRKVEDILDVWFESGATHAFVLEPEEELFSPASLYLEGTDQHRGWFQSSLLEACGTRGRAPFEQVITHGFLLDGKGRKMSKSGGNAVSPNEFVEQRGSDILRLWVASSDYEQDLRFGEEAITTTSDAYRKLRNALRFMLGNLHLFSAKEEVAFEDAPELEQLLLSYLAKTAQSIEKQYSEFNYRAATKTLLHFTVNELSSFYFDIRKDALYCDSSVSPKRRAARTNLHLIFNYLTQWLAPILCFTAEEAWCAFYGDEQSVHLQSYQAPPKTWLNPELEAKWEKIKEVRKVVLAALEIERQEKNIGSSLEAAPEVFIADADTYQAAASIDMAEVAITSQLVLHNEAPPKDAFCLADPSIGVLYRPAQGKKCARSWKILPEVGSVAAYPTLSPRDAEAVAEFEKNNPPS